MHARKRGMEMKETGASPPPGGGGGRVADTSRAAAIKRKCQAQSRFKLMLYAMASLIMILIAALSIHFTRDSGDSQEPDTPTQPNQPVQNARSGALEALATLKAARGANWVQDPILTYKAIQELPHDSNAFTQGLEYYEGKFIESTGIILRSSLREVEILTGVILQKISLGPEHFGEGCTVFNGKIYQITWRTNTCFVYDAQAFVQTGTFTYSGEGWGITHDATRLIMSDGSSTIKFRDPDTFQVLGQIAVTDPLTGQEVTQLNELEYVDGEIWSNIWHSDLIARIDPSTGNVVGYLDMSDIHPARSSSGLGEDVLNGIAYYQAEDRLWVTGKLWPSVWEIEVMPKL